MVGGVFEAVERDLGGLDASIADSALAALALALAREIDDRGNSATSKSMCAKALSDTLVALRRLAPDVTDDKLDDLTLRRERRLAKAAG